MEISYEITFPGTEMHHYGANITVKKLPYGQLFLSQAQPKVKEAASVDVYQHLGCLWTLENAFSIWVETLVHDSVLSLTGCGMEGSGLKKFLIIDDFV